MPQLSTATIQVPLRPISDTEAIILGIGRTRGETVSIIGGEGGERIRYSGLFGRKVTAGTG
jgi:acetyl-CoA carboxylase alpha subunit